MIEKCSPGMVIIDGKEYTSDLLVVPPSPVEADEGRQTLLIDRIVCPWKRKADLVVTLADLTEIIPAWPKVLIIGTGFSDQMKLVQEVRTVLSNRNINVIAFPTDQACEAYNEMAASAKTACALYLK